MTDVIAHRGPDKEGQHIAPGSRSASGASTSSTSPRATSRSRTSAATCGPSSTARSSTTASCAASSRRTATARDGRRHRDDRPPLRAARRRLPAPAARHVRDRGLGRAQPAPGPRRATGWGSSRSTSRSPRRPRLRLGDQVADRRGPVEPRLDPLAAELYLAYGYVPGPRTLFEGVPSRARDDLGLGGRGARRGVALLDAVEDTPPSGGSWEEDQEALLELLREPRPRPHDQRRVPLGVMLSGGVDSSLITAALMSEVSSACRDLSIGFTDDARNANELRRRAPRRTAVRHRPSRAPDGRRRPL